MASIHLPQPYSSDPASEINTHSTLRPPVRPRFHHQNTHDRIREGSGRPPTFSMISKIKKDRKSIFKELGLDTDEPSRRFTSEHEFGYITGLSSPASATRTSRRVFQSDSDGDGDDGRSDTEKPRADERERQFESESQRPSTPRTSSNKPWYTRLSPGRRPRIKTVGSAPPFTMSSRLSTTALLIAVVLPAFSYYNGREQVSLSGADAGVMRSTGSPIPVLETRADSPTDVCARWAHQAAHLNGTLYIYGGQAKRTKDQTTDAWNNYFLTLDLTKSWDVSSPALKGLPQPDGPPKVSMGYLWHDYNNLFLYGGEFADNPFVEPSPSSTWRYAINDKQWTEFQNPKTSRGNNSDGGDTQVQRAAEGAGVSVPELGLSWYFGGHLDLSTTQGWSNQIPRVYLKSLLEFTHPGYTNNAIYSLADGTGAGESGAYRNITEGGLQANSAFYERADGVLVFVPGWGEKGVLVGLAGGTNETFTDDLSVLDVYDIARSEWYHQETRGAPPSVRVNPCAVIASAPDASSFQIYVYGGQNLLPYGEQVQYSDMYILSIPSFTWIKAPQSQGPSNPAPRAGHTCNLRDGQMVVVGGYIGKNKPCDSPGIYVFDASTLQWKSSFTALGSKPDLNPENSVLAGSYGYRVPQAVAKVIGGDENGGATVSTPAAGPATGGPFATGKSPAFTVTDAGSTATITRWGPGATDTNGPVAPGTGGASGGSGGETPRQAGLIAAGVIAGLAGLLALYLGYCAWLYRRQVRAYKSHLAVTNRYAGASTTSGWGAFFGGRKSSKESTKSARAAAHEPKRRHLRDQSMSTVSDGGDYNNYNSGNNKNSWDGQRATEPKFMLDDEPTPESGYYSGTGASGSGMVRPAPVVGGWWADTSAGGSHGSGGTGTSQGASSGGREKMTSALGGRGSAGETRGRMSEESSGSMDALIQGQEPSFFSVVLGPRRALRVVNGLEEVHGLEGDIDHDREGDHDWEEYTGGGYTGGGGYRVPPDDGRGEGNTMRMSRS